MSGALIELISKGTQDVYFSSPDSTNSLFSMKFSRYTNFAQSVKPLEIQGVVGPGQTSVINLLPLGDLINAVWFEGTPNLASAIRGSTFSLYIGGNVVDTQTSEFLTDIWQVYMAETYTKCQTINNVTANSDPRFFPMHFFFCDNGLFLPLLCLQYHAVEIRITWGPNMTEMPKVYGNYVFLDEMERTYMVSKPMDIIVTQVQQSTHERNIIDLSIVKQPVKSLYFGRGLANASDAGWDFNGIDFMINGTYLMENASNCYFHTVQGYYHNKFGLIKTNYPNNNSPYYTGFYHYNFCLDATSYKPTGTCNFSRLDSGRMVIYGNSMGENERLTLYAVGYNILRIKLGLGGILFSN